MRKFWKYLWKSSEVIALSWALLAVWSVSSGQVWVALIWAWLSGAGLLNGFAIRDERKRKERRENSLAE